MRSMHDLGWLVLVLVMWPASAADAQISNPLKPADTSTPRATLKSFIDNINNMYRLIQVNRRDKNEKTKDAKKLSEKEKEANVFRASIYQRRAVSCLDLSDIDPEVLEGVAKERAILLSEILDRIPLPDLQAEFDDEEAFRKGDSTRYRLPNTEIVIERIEEGPRAGEFLVSKETVKRLPEFHALVKHLPYKPKTVLENAYEKLTATAVVIPVKDTPLQPADTSSPQTTLKSFLDNMKIVYEASKGGPPSSDQERQKRRQAWLRARSCIDLSNIPPKLRQQLGLEKSVLLMEILSRLELPPNEHIPGRRELSKAGASSWTIPGTEISINRVKKGSRAGEYLFSAETVEHVEDFYSRIEHLPYTSEPIIEDAYHRILDAPGPWISRDVILRLPSWTRKQLWDQPVWKWLSLTVVLALVVLALVFAYRLSRGGQESGRGSFWARAVLPVCGIVLPLLCEHIVSDQIRLSGRVLQVMNVVFTLMTYAAAAWLVFLVGSALANMIIRSPAIREKSIHASMMRMLFRLLGMVVLVFLILWASADLGIPLTPVLAGLGVGGVAIALAAQNSVENLIGGFNLFLDRPVKVGDFCRFGDRLGTVEEIGLRSTRIRTLDDTVISVPNSTFSKQELENFNSRQKIWYHPSLRLRMETTPDQIRYMLIEIHKVLYGHPLVLEDSARVRFSGFAENALELDVFAYVDVADWGRYLEVAEELNLRILEVIKRAGSGLAVNAEVRYMEGLDAERARQVALEVDEWRQQDALYLPRLPAEKIAELREAGSGT